MSPIKLPEVVLPKIPSINTTSLKPIELQMPPGMLLSDHPPKEKPQGLFKQLLGGDIRELSQDLEAYPDKYDEPTKNLVRDLMGSGRKPSEAEEKVLDQAIHAFSRKPVTKKMELTEELAGKKGANPPDFWWLR